MERVWPSRLRWRLRGAWLGPLLVVLTIADGVLVHRLPIAGDGRTDLVAALLLASFLNLVAVAAIAPFLGMALRRLRPDLPRIVARDYAGAALVVLVTVGLLAAGLLHRDALAHNREALADAHARGQAWIGANAPAAYRRHVALADTIALVEGRLFRTCVPAVDGERAWCAIVRTDVAFPRGIRFGGGSPNAVYQPGGRE